MATLIQSIAHIRQVCGTLRPEGKRIGLVPTMGALHEGHLSLIRLAMQSADVVITTIFVNPAQFGPSEDFERYPRSLEKDCSLAFDAGAALVFAPTVADMYPEGYQTYVDVGPLGDKLEGRSRPGHFRGVATVVAKLFHITTPHIAVFGRKDAQQLAVIRAMVKDLSFPVEIIPAPIVREPDGLAMSSRNVYLTQAQRKEAPVIHRSLELAKEQIRNGAHDPAIIITAMRSMIEQESHGIVDYISIAHDDTLEEYSALKAGDPVLVSLAVRFGATRLIDNCSLTVE